MCDGGDVFRARCRKVIGDWQKRDTGVLISSFILIGTLTSSNGNDTSKAGALRTVSSNSTTQNLREGWVSVCCC